MSDSASSPPHRPHQWVPDSWPLPIRALSKLSGALARLEGLGLGICLIAIVFFATWQFIDRNMAAAHLPFFRVPIWIDGVIRHSVFLIGFLGGAYATYMGRNIRIDAITRLVPIKVRLALRALTTIIAIGIVYLFVRGAWAFYTVTLEEAGEASQVGQIFTSSRGALIIVIGYSVIAFHFFVQLILDLGWLIARTPPPDEWVAEASHGEGAEVAHGDAPVLPPTPETKS